MSVDFFKMTSITPEQREAATNAVKRGAAVLDVHRAGWRDRVALTSLDISSGLACILGQEFGDYSAGLDKLMRDVQDASEDYVDTYEFSGKHGFSEYRDYDGNGGYATWAALTEAWRVEIFGREMTTQEKFGVVISEQSNAFEKAAQTAESNVKGYREQIEALEKRILAETANATLNRKNAADGRAMVSQLLSLDIES